MEMGETWSSGLSLREKGGRRESKEVKGNWQTLRGH